MNIIENAILLLDDINNDEKINLDADDTGFLISNNGPSISQRDYSAIFDQEFTRKPGGRGLGLFISKKALQSEHMDIETLPNKEKRGVTITMEGV